MSNPNRTIAWISGHKDKFNDFAKLLGRLGYHVTWIHPPQLDSTSIFQQWLETELPPKIDAIFIDGRDWELHKAMLKSRGSFESARELVVPWIWVEEALKEEDSNYLSTIGIDDLILSNMSSSLLAERLRLATNRARHQTEWLLTSKEQSIKDAARETAVGQREEFLSVCAHDLRSPIGLVKSSLSLLLNKYKDQLDENIIELIERCTGQTEHAIRLVNDLLDVMSFEQGLKPKYALIDLENLMTEFYSSYQVLADEQQVKIIYKNNVPDWRIVADKDRLLQILENLLSNALKYSSKGKSIYIDVKSFTGRRASDPKYPMLVITVRDEGMGIPVDRRESIFNRFSQIKDTAAEGGYGLGLSVAKQISNLHAGNVWVTGEEGKGAEFNVLLPHAISRTENEVLRSADDASLKVLLIEPNESKRKNLEGKLSRWGVQPYFAVDGVDAIVQCFHERPDVVVLSASISRVSGEEVLKILHSHSETKDSIILATQGEGSESESNLISSVDAVVPSPISKPTFLKTVQKVREKRKEADPTLKKAV